MAIVNNNGHVEFWSADKVSGMKTRSEIKTWRKGRCGELIVARDAVVPAQRKTWGERITALLEAVFALPSDAVIDFCWP